MNADPSNAPTFDVDQVRRWLGLLHGTSPGLLHICSTDNWRGEAFNDAGSAAMYAERLDRGGRAAGIYARATTLRAPLPPGTSRGGAEYSLALPGLWSDLDIDGPGHQMSTKRLPLPPDEESVRKVIAKSGLPEPTVWMDTGGGYYAWWLLREPHTITDDLDDIRRLSLDWHEVLDATSKSLGWSYDRGVHDLARVLRLPGTVNRKPKMPQPQPCVILTDNGPRYTLTQLREALERLPAPIAPVAAPPTTPQTSRPPQAVGDLAPGEDFNRRADWMSDILGPRGWKLVGNVGRELRVQRPDKDGHQCSGTINHEGTDRLKVFTTSTEFDTDGTYSKFGAWTLLNYNGDHRAAARELRRRGYGSPRAERPPMSAPPKPPRPVDPTPELTDDQREAEWQATIDEGEQRERQRAAALPLFDARTAPREAILRGLHPTIEAAADHWDDPDPMGGTGDPPQPLPLDVLPEVLAGYVLELAHSTQTPTDMAVMQVLAALSVVAANRYWISGGAGWIEPLVLWTLTALPPASRKSAVVSAVTKPLYILEREMREAHRKEHHGKDDLLAVAEQRRKQIMAEMARAKTMIGRKKLEHDLSNVKAEIEKYTVGPAKQLLADDVTPEALGMILQDNDGHVGMMSAEGGVFGAITGRYTQGSPQLDLILKAYDGDPYRANRVGRGPVSIDHPAVVLGLAVQPHVLAETAKTPALRERGLMGRFAYAVPQDTVGVRSVVAPEMSDTARADWHHTLARIARAEACGPGQPRRILPLHPDALELHRGFRETLEPRLHGHTGDLAFLADWAGKLAGRILRIAGLLHIAEGRTNADQVPFPTMVAAVELGEAMLTHAVHVYGGWRTPEVNAGAVRVLDWVRRAYAGRPEDSEAPIFTVRDAHQALRGQEWCKTSDAARDALIVLVRAGWLTTVERFMADGKRRAPAGFVPHPKALEGQTR